MPAVNLPRFSTQNIMQAAPLQVFAPGKVSCRLTVYCLGPGSVYVSDQPTFALATAFAIAAAGQVTVLMYGDLGLYCTVTSDNTLVSFQVAPN